MTTKSVFSERLNLLMKEKGVTQTTLSDAVGITKQSISMYSNAHRVPDIDVFKKICEFFKVSADYLLGLSDVKSFDVEIKAISEKTGLSGKAVETLIGLESIETTLNKINKSQLKRYSYEVAETIGEKNVNEIMNLDIENNVHFQTVFNEFVADNRFYDFFVIFIDYAYEKILLNNYEKLLKEYINKGVDNNLIKDYFGAGFENFESLDEITQESAKEVIKNQFTSSITDKLFKDQKSNGDHECLSFMFYKEVQKIFDSIALKFKDNIINTKNYKLRIAKLSFEVADAFKEYADTFSRSDGN